VGKNQAGTIPGTLAVVSDEHASAERVGSPWYIGHDPELVEQVIPVEPPATAVPLPARTPARTSKPA
jgi:hypothetical protein